MDSYSQRALESPGRGRFRIGISLRPAFTRPSGPSRSGSSGDRFILLVSFPYFGGSSEKIKLGPESESVKLLDFKPLEVGVHAQRGVVGKEKKDGEEKKDGKKKKDGKRKDGTREIPVEEGEMLVHQARYMIFDNCQLYLSVYF